MTNVRRMLLRSVAIVGFAGLTVSGAVTQSSGDSDISREERINSNMYRGTGSDSGSDTGSGAGGETGSGCSNRSTGSGAGGSMDTGSSSESLPGHGGYNDNIRYNKGGYPYYPYQDTDRVPSGEPHSGTSGSSDTGAGGSVGPAQNDGSRSSGY